MAAVMKEIRKPVAKTSSKAPTLGTMIDEIWIAREAKRVLEEQLKTVDADLKAREEAIVAKLDKEGIDASRGKKATVSITSTLHANLVDYDAFVAYVKKTGYFHLFQRRVTDTAARELFESVGNVPGLEPFTKRRLNLRSL